MSHKATYWLATVAPDRITAGAFRVLFHLCDHHNDERDPTRACFPSQETLMRKTGLSNGGLNNCLAALEGAGLLRRKRSNIPGTRTPRTYYILGCDVPEGIEQTPESGDSTDSSGVETENNKLHSGEEQTPLLRGTNSSGVETNLKGTEKEKPRAKKSAQRGPPSPPADSGRSGRAIPQDISEAISQLTRRAAGQGKGMERRKMEANH